MAQLPINLNASQKSKDLLNYLYSISGMKTLTGIHNYFEDPNYWANIVQAEYGDYAAVQGFEMGALLGQDLTTQANMRQATVNGVINHHNRGGICHMSWHQNFAFKPFEWNGGVYDTNVTQEQFDRLVTPGTAEYNWLIAEYDRAAPYFTQIRDANVPLVMRPYHEMNAPWFWWGHRWNYQKLWDIMYDRFTNVYGLNNILWLWSANNPKNSYEAPYPDYFVGTNKCDILGVDIYLWVTVANAPGGEAYRQSDHDGLAAISGGKPIVLSEIGHIPDISVLDASRYVWFLEWGDYYRDPIKVWSGDTIAQNTKTDRDKWFPTSVSRTLSLSEVSISAAPPDTQAPTVPSNLAVSSKTTASVLLTWAASTDNVGVTGYDVYKDGVFLATAITNSYNVTGLAADTNYTLKVRARDAAGNLSAFSTDLVARTDVGGQPVKTVITHITDAIFAPPVNSISVAPRFPGQLAVVGANAYIAVGTSISDWKKLSYDTGFVTLISDDFDRANSTTTLGVSWNIARGTWGILNNRAYVSSNIDGSLAYRDAAQANYIVTALVNGYGWAEPTNLSLPEIVVRYTDLNNYLVVYPYNGQLYLDKFDVGTGSTLTSVPITLTESTSHMIKVTANGTNIKAYMDGVLKIDYTLVGSDATKFIATNVGMKLERAVSPITEAWWDSFIVTTL